jgi:hypothetical protein
MATQPNAGGELTDDALQGEIELVGELVVAASASDGPLTEEEIDRVLGVDRAGQEHGSDHASERGVQRSPRLDHEEKPGRRVWRRQQA